MEELHYSLSISSFRRYVLVNARERRKRAEDDKELAYVQAVPSDKYIWACHVAPGCQNAVQVWSESALSELRLVLCHHLWVEIRYLRTTISRMEKKGRRNSTCSHPVPLKHAGNPCKCPFIRPRYV